MDRLHLVPNVVMVEVEDILFYENLILTRLEIINQLVD